MNTIVRNGIAILAGLCLFSVMGCETTEESWHDADKNPGAETPTSGDATLVVHVRGAYTVNIYLDEHFIGAVQPDQSRTWDIPVGHHECEGHNADDSYSPTSWSFDVAAGQTEERWVEFVPK